MTPAAKQRKLARLRNDLNCVGHRAYSMDNLESKAAVQAFAKLDRIKAEIAELEGPPITDADIDKAIEAWNATAGHPQFAHLIHNRFEREQMRAALKAVRP